MADDTVLDLNRPKLFAPAITRTIIGKPGGIRGISLNEMASRNFGNTGSFRYDGPQEGLKSTQQLGLDFSKFENHTFFNSGQSKTNVAFDRIINFFPFDSSRKEIELFMDTLTGFENYVFQRIPKYKGYLNFSGSGTGGRAPKNKGGSYIKVKDSAGSAFPEFSTDNSGLSILNPGLKSFTIDMHLFIPDQNNDNQVICQMLGREDGSSGGSVSDRGFTLGLVQSEISTASIFFSALSGSDRIYTAASLNKGQFNRIVATYDRENFDAGRLNLYINRSLKSYSNRFDLGDFYLHTTNFTIGSGSAWTSGSGGEQWVPTETLSGSIDELRFFHTVRDIDQQKSDNTSNLYASDDLKLYFKFNEPTGSHSLANVVLDSSGNSLHSTVLGYSQTFPEGLGSRLTGSLLDPMVDEDVNVSPVLFPGYFEIKGLIRELLASGSAYDMANPNLITKLVPNHYLQAGMEFEGLPAEDTGITQPFAGSSLPGSGKMTSSQLIIAFLLVWAKFFDEIKMFIDEFSNLTFIDYDSDVSVANQFLYFAGKYYGIDLPRIFSDPSVAQYIDGDNLKIDLSRSASSLHFVQNEIWRRLLTNLPHIVRTKGTVESVKAVIRSIGIIPENNFRIREYGGPIKRELFDRTEQRSEISTMLDFSGSLAPDIPEGPSGKHTKQGFNDRMPYITSSFLSGARIEPGFPNARPNTFRNTGDGVPGHDIWGLYRTPPTAPYTSLPRGPGRNNMGGGYVGPGIARWDAMGLFTSASWTYEGIYKMPTRITGVYTATQSLARMMVTGTDPPSDTGGLIFNLVAFSGSRPRICLFGKPTSEAPEPNDGTHGDRGSTRQSEVIILSLTGTNIFDGNKWNISFGTIDRPSLLRAGQTAPSISASLYFLRAARSRYGGGILDFNATSSFFNIIPDSADTSMFNVRNTLFQGGRYYLDYNRDGAYIAIGSQSIALDNNVSWLASYGNRFLNRTDISSSHTSTFGDTVGCKETRFEGTVGHMRWWTQALTENEWRRHVISFKSLGTEDPLLNYNFSSWESGSWERLRLDVSTDQTVTESNVSGEIKLIDFSQNKKDPVLFASASQVGPPRWSAADTNLSKFGNYSFSGRGFEKSARIIKPERFFFASLSPKFDMRESDKKIRVRGYKDPQKVKETPYAEISPVNEIQPWLEPDDDLRFSIEFSATQALDEDIMGLFADLGFFNDALGDPTLLFSDFYPDIDQMREIYFNRLSDKINFKLLFDFFKWFDTTFSAIIEQVIPRKVNFLGINYVVESHVLERAKMRYLQDEIYLDIRDRDIISGITATETFEGILE